MSANFAIVFLVIGIFATQLQRLKFYSLAFKQIDKLNGLNKNKR